MTISSFLADFFTFPSMISRFFAEKYCPVVINSWMMAADYFMCAHAHGITIAPPELNDLSTATIRHLVWRFRRFYGDRDMLRTMVGWVGVCGIFCQGGTCP